MGGALDAQSARQERVSEDARNGRQGREEHERRIAVLAQHASGLDAVAAAAQKHKRLALELVATSRDPMATTIAGVAIAVEPGDALYVPVSHRYLGAPPQLAEKDVLEALRPAIESRDIEIIGHDLKFIDVALRQRGIRLAGPIFDSMLASYLLDPELATVCGVDDRTGADVSVVVVVVFVTVRPAALSTSPAAAVATFGVAGFGASFSASAGYFAAQASHAA